MLIHVTAFISVKIEVDKNWNGQLLGWSRACTNTVIIR